MTRLVAIVLAGLSVAPVAAQAAQPAPAVSSTSVEAVDPARLAIAQRIAGRLMPDGTYRKMMRGMLDGMMGSLTNNMMTMPGKNLARMSGLDETKLASMGGGTLREIAEIMDPAFDRRMKIGMDVMMAGIIDVISAMEPDLREGVAEAYAQRFTLGQLTDIEHFFQSPSGAAYAEQSMLMASDPAMMRQAQAMMPKVMEAMPGLMKKIESATADLPKRRTIPELSPADKERLTQLMGVDPKEVK